MINVEFEITANDECWEIITPAIAVLKEPNSFTIGIGFLVFNVVITFNNESND